jgi:hypothetical protein
VLSIRELIAGETPVMPNLSPSRLTAMDEGFYGIFNNETDRNFGG